MIAAESIDHGYDDGRVLSDVSLRATEGAVLGLIGPSGTGKTTLLRLLALFEPPADGTVRVEGDDVWTLDRTGRFHVRRRVGMVFQDRSLFSTSVAHNAGYGLAVRQSWRKRARRWLSGVVGDPPLPEPVADALETVGLRDMADRPAASLSAGEAQRVAFARALATDPDVLLLDEPTSNLDPRNTAVIEDAIADARDRGIAVVIATHDMSQAERVADRVGVMLDGSIIEHGRVEQVFDAPRDERARKFISGELVY